MGITIHYRLAYDGTEHEVRQALDRVIEAAIALGFQTVSGLDCLVPDGPLDDDQQTKWARLQYQRDRRLGRRCPSHPGGVLPNGRACFCSRVLPPTRGWVVRTVAGEGCEQMNIGLAQYGRAMTTKWMGAAFCKTQYATDFVGAHLKAIGLLDACRRIGILRSVHDEAGYWTKRDVVALLQEVGQWDAMQASMAARLRALAGPSAKVEAAIEHMFGRRSGLNGSPS